MENENKVALEFAGIEFLPHDVFLEEATTIRCLLEAAYSGQVDLAQLPSPTFPIHQIFVDQKGDYYLVVPSDGDSPAALPYITGSELGSLANTRQSGFMPVGKLVKTSSSSAPSSSNFPDPAPLIGQLTTDVAESFATGESVGGAALGQIQSQLVGLVLSQVPESFHSITGETIRKSFEKAPQLFSDTGGSIKNPLGDLKMSDIGSTAAGGLVDQGFSGLTNNWKVYDRSSTLEQAAHRYGMEALDKVKGYITEQLKDFVKETIDEGLTSAADKLGNQFGNTLEGLGDKFDLFFNGMKSNAVLPAAYITSKDDKADVVITGFPTVLMEGIPVSRVSDLLEPSKKIILEGAATVLAGGLPVSRVTSDTAIPSDLLTGAKTVLIGGPSVRILPPIKPKKVETGDADTSWRRGKKSKPETSDLESRPKPETSDLESRPKPETSDLESRPCLLYTSPSPRDGLLSRMPSSA